MNLIKTIFLGIIQGLSEFLPISSSGHLVIFQSFFKMKSSQITLEIILHLGSLLAVIFYFRKELWELFLSLFKRDFAQKKFVLYLFISTLTTSVLAYFLEDFLEKIFYNYYLVLFLLLITGIILFMSDKVKNTDISIYKMGFRIAFFIGLAQTIAILPGISRSGITIAALLFFKIKREETAYYSFLLSIPIILGASILKIKDITCLDNSLLLEYFLGALFAFLSGYIVIKFLMNLVSKSKLKYFSYYCWGFSLFAFLIKIFW